MNKEELFQEWVGIDYQEDAFYKDLDKYYEARLMVEARKFLEVIKAGTLEGVPL